MAGGVRGRCRRGAGICMAARSGIACQRNGASGQRFLRGLEVLLACQARCAAGTYTRAMREDEHSTKAGVAASSWVVRELFPSCLFATVSDAHPISHQYLTTLSTRVCTASSHAQHVG